MPTEYGSLFLPYLSLSSRAECPPRRSGLGGRALCSAQSALFLGFLAHGLQLPKARLPMIVQALRTLPCTFGLTQEAHAKSSELLLVRVELEVVVVIPLRMNSRSKHMPLIHRVGRLKVLVFDVLNFRLT